MKIFIPRFWLGVVITLLLFAPITRAQVQAPKPELPPQRVIINFLLPIDSNSVNLLLAVVNNQVRVGIKNITIVISSGGGDTASALAAYNILRNVPAEITTFNAGNVDSAALLIYCAGKHRYSFSTPARFLIHGNQLTFGTGVPLDSNALEAYIQQLKSLNEMVVQIITSTSNKTRTEIEGVVNGQKILSPEQAKEWGIVQEIRTTFMEPGAVFVSVNTPTPADEKKPATIISKTPY